LIKSELNRYFDIDLSTLHRWDKNDKSGRKLLYEVLKALPIEFVEGVKKKLEDEEKLKESLKKDD
jgi:hypothetical protein